MRQVIVCLLVVLWPVAMLRAASISFDTKVPPSVVLVSGKSPVSSHAVEKLRQYIEQVTGKFVGIEVTDVPEAILIGDATLARDYHIAEPDESRDESFSIAPVALDDHRVLIVSGTTDKGIKQGVYHLLRNVRCSNGKITIDNVDIQSSPFIKLRVSHVGGAMNQPFDRETGKRNLRGVPPTKEQLHWNHIDQWPAVRVGEYAEMLDFFGYNGIEEPPVFYDPKEADAESVARRKTLRQHLDACGMIGVAKIDGTLDGIPYGADTAANYDEYYRTMAQSAAPYNEFVLTHWVDGGGWKSTPDHPCTIELLQKLHMQIDDEFKRVNPDIRSILSLWNLHNPTYDRWKGYQPAGVETILDSGVIPPQVGIAMSKTWQAEEAKKILAAKHPLAVWAWYVADNELVYTMHVHTHQLKEYFQQFPPEAHEQLFMHVMDNCQRETNVYSVYVAARMMWDPKQDPEVYLREIARLIYGPKLEARVFDGLKCIADVRCGDKQCIGYWHTREGNSNGVLNFDQALKQSNQAWEGLKEAQLDPDYHPPIKLQSPTGEMLEILRGQVEAVATYMQYLKDKQESKTPPREVPRADGPFEYYERLQYLQKR